MAIGGRLHRWFCHWAAVVEGIIGGAVCIIQVEKPELNSKQGHTIPETISENKCRRIHVA